MKIILWNHQNNYVKNSSVMNNTIKNFDILVINLSVHLDILIKFNFRSISS